MPRLYLAWANNIAEQLKQTRGGAGETILYENHTWKSGVAAGITDSIPTTWRFTPERLVFLLNTIPI